MENLAYLWMILESVVYIMSRSKRNRKYVQKQKRLERKKKGKLVRFDLQNSSRKYPGINNKYCYQTNIHRLIYKDGTFSNVKYQASNITQCNFKNCKLYGVDFCNTNLKKTSFKGAILKDVLFFNCNLKEVDFENAKFENVYFVSTNINVCKHLVMDAGCVYMNKYPKIDLDGETETALFRLSQISRIFKYHVLHVDKTKINMWTFKILYDKYGSDTGRALLALTRRKDKRGFFTISSYMNFIEKYLKL